MNDMEDMRVFADQLWEYMLPKLEDKLSSQVSYFRAQVVRNPGGGFLEIQRPLEEGTLTLPCVNVIADARPGSQVIAFALGSLSNAVVVADGRMNIHAGGGGEVPDEDFFIFHSDYEDYDYAIWH